MRQFVLPAILLGGLTSCGELPTAPVQLSAPVAARADAHVYIPGRYIVRFKPSSGPDAFTNGAAVGSMYGGAVDRVFTSINGVAMQLPDAAAAALRNDARVLSVEQDEVISKHTVQSNATWGLDRIDQRARPLSTSYTYNATGSGVTVYILDSGINFAQADFAGRASAGYDAITPGGTAADCDGHGTHVAGTVGSETYGVAKDVQLVAVRVLDCSGNGTTSSVLAGIDWVTNHRVLPAVANMSLGGGTSSTINNAVETSIASGVTYAVSAGNSTTDACLQSPASAPSVLAVGATDSGDAYAWYSNYGSCVDILAPGTSITSWWTGTGTNTISGTSMASPHVAGAAALYLQVNPTAAPSQVRTALIGNATASAISAVPAATPNLLLYTGFIATPVAPVADFTFSCVGTSCTFDGSSSTSAWNNATYLWNFGDNTSSTTKTIVHTYAALGTYSVSLTVTDANGTNTRTKSVTLNRAPTASITTPAAGTLFAQGASVSFTGTGTDPEDGTLTGASLVWRSDVNGIIGTGTSFSTSTLSPGPHTITLTATDAQGLAGTATRSIAINRPPVASITAPLSGAVVAIGTSVTFTGTATDPEDSTLSGASLTWTSSIDGVLGTGTSLTTATLSGGTHTITLTGRDALNAAGSATITLVVNRPPTASITAPAANASFSPGTAITFTGSGTDAEDGALSGPSLVWTSSLDGQIGTGGSFTYSALSVGTHVITLTARDSRNATGTTSRTITITGSSNQAPVARFTWSCPTKQCTMDASTSTDDVGIVKYTWAWGDGRIENRVGPIVKNTWQVANIYTVTLTVTDAGGLTNTVSRQVSVPNQAPVATIASPAAGSVFALGAGVTLSGSATDLEDGVLSGAALIWSSSLDGVLGTGASVTTSALSGGTHVITLTASDVLNAVGTATRTIVINRPPSAVIASPATNSTVTQGTLVTLSGSGTDPEDGALAGASLAWTSSRDGALGTGASVATSALTVGTHTITLTATDSRGATAVASITLTVAGNAAPTAAITAPANNSSFVQGIAVTFSGSGTDAEDGQLSGASLAWTSSIDGAIGSGASVTTSALSVGTHVITLTARDSRNATGAAAITITVTANQPPVPTIAAPTAGATVVAGASVTFSGSAVDPESGTLSGSSLTWASSLDGALGTGTSFSVNSLSVGTHSITLTARDALGASATTTVSLVVAANQAPTASITTPAANASFVRGSAVSFSGTGTDAEDGALSGASLSWSSSIDGVIGTGTSFSTTTLTAGTHVITLTARDSRNATGTASRTITITTNTNQPPVARFTWSCPTLQCTMDATTSSDDVGIVKYTWAWGDGRVENRTSATAKNTWQVTNVYTITLTVTDAGGLTNSVSRQVSVPNQAPVAAIASPAAGSVFALGAGVTLTGSATDLEDGALSGTALTWSSSLDGVLGTGASVTTSALSGGTHVITLTASDVLNAVGTATRTIVINRPPSAVIASPATNSTVTQGTLVTLSGSGTDPEDGALAGASLAWTSSRDGALGTGGSVATSALTVGTHTITLTATDTRGATAAASITLTVAGNNAPTASITSPANGTTVLTGTSVTFAGSGSDQEDGALTGAALTWSSSRDGQIGTGTTFSTSALSIGTHVITLTARDALNATGSASITLTIAANQPPVASITAPANNSAASFGSTVAFSGTGTDPETGALTGASLTWTSSLDGALGTGTSLSLASLRVGVHTITLTARDAFNATGTASITLTINAVNVAPTASITAPANNSTVLLGSSVTFTGSGSDQEDGVLSGSSLVWTSSINGQIGTGTSFSTTGLSAGTHTVTLTARDVANATGTATITLTVNRPPTASITAPANNSSVTFGNSVTLTGTGTDPETGALSGAALAWSSNLDGALGAGTSLSLANLRVGVHTITLTARDAFNATGSATITLTVVSGTNASPTATITSPAANSYYFVGASVPFAGTGTDPEDGALSGASLVWTSSLNGQIGTGTSFSTTTLSVGTHTITLTVRDSQGATAVVTRTVNIKPKFLGS